MRLPPKETMEQLKDISSIIQKCILALGVWILFCYCLSWKIMPDGLSLGDAMVLILIALGFGAVMLVGLWFGAFVALAPVKLIVLGVNLFKKAGEKRHLPVHLQGIGISLASTLGLLVVTLFAVSAQIRGGASDLKIAPTIACFAIMGLMLLCAFAVKWPEKPARTMASNVALALASILGPIFVLHPALSEITMTALGVRSVPGSLVLLSNEDHQKLDEIAKNSGLVINFCQLPSSGKWATTDVRVVWHGIGTTSYIRLLDHASGGEYALAVSMPKSSIEIVNPARIKLLCEKVLQGKSDEP